MCAYRGLRRDCDPRSTMDSERHAVEGGLYHHHRTPSVLQGLVSHRHKSLRTAWFVSDGNGGVLRVCSFTCPGYPDTGVHTGIFLAHESHSGDSQYHVLSTTTSLATFSVF